MQTNLLKAIGNVINSRIFDLSEHYVSRNRANNMGESLEAYVKDIFCNSLNDDDPEKDYKVYSQYFSYKGSQNTPPDLIIRGGDAIEVKKIENISSSIALNSSYPKDKLYADSRLISEDCRNCENWEKKDILYIIGVVNKKRIRCLWFVYGDCYAANRDVYERIRNSIITGINNTPDVMLDETNELGRINNVDPLGITYFRIRGMWGIKNPITVFNVPPIDEKAKFSLYAIMKEEKYMSFPNRDRNFVESIKDNNLEIKNINIKSPNNPMKFFKGKLIRYEL